MTRYSDNIYSGFQAVTSALSSKSVVRLTKGPYAFAGAGNTTAVTRTGVFPPGTQLLTARVWITQQGSATVSDKIVVSAGGTDLITIDQFGSATGTAADTKAGLARFTYVASACFAPPVPASSNNGGEIPFSVTFTPVSADKTSVVNVELNFSRADSNTLGITA